jgi:PAS domain-containing protein
MASTAVYVLDYGLELASLDAAGMLFWSKVEYIGILTFPTIYLIFSAQYSGYAKWLTRRNATLLYILPEVLLMIKFFDGQLHLIYSSVILDTGSRIPLLAFTRGPLYLVVTLYNVLVVTLGKHLLGRKWRFASSLYRWQTSVILSAALVLYLMYGFYLSGITPVPALKDLDINPFIYSLWGLATGIAISKYRLFDLAPIARETLIEMLSDGVVVVDAHARIVDANPEAQRMFGWEKTPVGQSVEIPMNNWINQALLKTSMDQQQLKLNP